MRERFVAAAASLDQRRIATRDRLARRLALFRLKRAAPQDGLGIRGIALDQQLLLRRRRGKIYYGHLAPPAEQEIVAGVDPAAGGNLNQLALGICLLAGQ